MLSLAESDPPTRESRLGVATREPRHITQADGHSYERASIAAWLEGHDTSPKTNEVLAHRGLTPNHNLRGQIREFQDRG